MPCTKTIDIKLICVQEGHTGIVELKSANHDDEAVAEDDPEAVRLMIDYLYLGDYDLDVITKHPCTSPAVENNATLDSYGSLQQEIVKQGASTEMGMEQREDTTLGPDPNNTDPAVHQPEVRTLSVKKKKKKGTAKQLNYGSSPLISQSGIGDSKSLPAEKPLAMHARMYSIAAKYNIRPLMDTAVMKFKSTANGVWDVQDLIAAVHIVYNQTVGHEEELRDILEVMILEHTYKLVPETGFREAIECVEGLTFSLFRRMGALSRHQKVCRRCGAVFMSTCALEGCRPAPFRGYSHDCDLKGPCRDCRQFE